MQNVYFNTSAKDIVSELPKATWEDKEKVKQIDLTKLSPVSSLDSFETKNLTDMLYELYPNYYAKQPMPKSLFGNRFGYDMQKEIGQYMRDFYTGNISQSELADFFEECCQSMRKYAAGKRWTSGDDGVDQQKIVGEIYEIFAKENARAAVYANDLEGETMNMSYGGRKDDWVYYNSDYHYKCEKTKKMLQEAAEDMTNKWGIPSVDTEEIEKNSGFTVDGGFDFNSVWNFVSRNLKGQSNIEDESIVPPENFKFFYKEGSSPDGGDLWCSMNGRETRRKVPFCASDDGLQGDIFSLKSLLGDFFRTGNMGDWDFLSNFRVFTRWYAYRSGINNTPG